MAVKHAFENLLRAPYEFWVAGVALGFGMLCLKHHHLLAFDVQMGTVIAFPFFLLSGIRCLSGLRVMRFRQRLLSLKPFAMSTTDVPVSRDHLYIGQGFKWLPIHRQRLYLLSLVQNQRYIQKGWLYRWIQSCAKDNPHGLFAKLTQIKHLPFHPPSKIGGKPWIHGVGADGERAIYLDQVNRTRHICVFGMTQVGKTRFSSILVNQDIRGGDAVLLIDPKGDLGMMQDIYCAAASADRLDDLQMIHLGFPELSAKYNPLASFSNVSEVANRIAGAISSEGAFKDFAWQYVNVVAMCLHDLKKTINYRTIAFYIKQPELLLIEYVDAVFPGKQPGYLADVQEIIDKHNERTDKNGNPVPPLKRAVAIKRYLTRMIETQAQSGQTEALMDSLVFPLYNAAMLDKNYYDKITASVGPVLDKINQTQAQSIFSWDYNIGLPEVSLEEVLRRKKIVYIGLDSLSNKAMAEAVGQAIIADLVSLCGRLYNESSDKKLSLCLHCDEFSNIVREEFVNLLNKAGGAGVKVTAYTQTINDLGAAFSNLAKAKMLMGNFGTTVSLLVENEDTADSFVRCVEQVRTRSSVPSTISNDHADHKSGELFKTANTDSISEEQVSLVQLNDLFSLPKGQAFVRTNGGEVYKVRMPLPKNDGSAPPTFETLLKGVNLCCV